MGRLVRKPQIPDLDAQIAGLEGVLQSGIGSLGGMQMAGARPGDNYLERMAKYVPAEIIAFSMIINSILEQAMKTGGKNAVMAGFPVASIAAGALGLALVLTPLFCWYVREEGDAWVVNAFVSTIAFPFWAYLMGAVAFADHHDGNLADPGADLYRRQRAHFAAGAPSEAAAQAEGARRQGGTASCRRADHLAGSASRGVSWRPTYI
jgi:hypothetical protein